MAEKMCGTCEHYDSEGDCSFVPDEIPVPMDRSLDLYQWHMDADAGATCPCWGKRRKVKPKERAISVDDPETGVPFREGKTATGKLVWSLLQTREALIEAAEMRAVAADADKPEAERTTAQSLAAEAEVEAVAWEAWGEDQIEDEGEDD